LTTFKLVWKIQSLHTTNFETGLLQIKIKSMKTHKIDLNLNKVLKWCKKILLDLLDNDGKMFSPLSTNWTQR